jgi:hypothetical protein
MIILNKFDANLERFQNRNRMKSSLENSFLNLLPSLFLLLSNRYEVPRGYDLMQNSFAILEGLKAM